MLWFFKKVNARGAKIITEHQSFEYHELVNQKRYHLAFCEKLFGKKCLHNVYGAVGVTKEIAEYEKSRSSKFKIAVVPNGIDVSSYPIKKRSTYDSKNGLDVLFVGAVSDWHGIDRFIKGMSISQAKTLRLHIVGDGSGVTNLKQIVMKDKLDEKVIFHDFKIGKELDDMFDKCQIAIGSLGLHRLDLSESSVLKVREYCARGIPFIYSPIDEDFPEYFHYRMKVSPDDSPIDIRKVIDFSKRVLSERQCSERMRDYAEKKLEWDVKIKKLSIFLDEIVQAEDKP
jgi:glycosyltransferase involved in cell wall biosynthesis